VDTERFHIGGLEIRPFRQDHGFSNTLGLRIGGFAYSVDVVELDETAFERLTGVDTWIVGCLGRRPHPTHAHLEKVLDWVGRVGPQRAWLSHMSHYLDYATLRDELPEHMAPAHDGLIIEM
jgi:phosphoribosyl 1,2-cyclic phosphate phosphodiesterase